VETKQKIVGVSGRVFFSATLVFFFATVQKGG